MKRILQLLAWSLVLALAAGCGDGGKVVLPADTSKIPKEKQGVKNLEGAKAPI